MSARQMRSAMYKKLRIPRPLLERHLDYFSFHYRTVFFSTRLIMDGSSSNNGHSGAQDSYDDVNATDFSPLTSDPNIWVTGDYVNPILLEAHSAVPNM